MDFEWLLFVNVMNVSLSVITDVYKKVMHFILKEGQYWTFVNGFNFPDGTT